MIYPWVHHQQAFPWSNQAKRARIGSDPRGLFELQDDNFRVRSEPQWRPPSAHTARCKNLHLAYTAQSVDKLAVDSTRHPAPGNELTDVCVPGKLQRDSCCFRHLGMVRCVSQQDARALAVNADALQYRREMCIARRLPVRHPNDL